MATSTQFNVPAPTSIVPNPLNNLASYTYSLSLWYISPVDYNRLASAPDVQTAMSWLPTKGLSYVIAEDSGLYPDWRLPVPWGLNYNITSFKIHTAFAQHVGASAQISGDLVIEEAEGFTFFDTMLTAVSATQGVLNNVPGSPPPTIQEMTLMLQVDFQGYDDTGTPVDVYNSLPPLRKRFPFMIKSVKTNMSNRGASYNMHIVPIPGQALTGSQYRFIPESYTITAATVDEFFNGPNGLAAKLNQTYTNQILTGDVVFADSYRFEIDPFIAASLLKYPDVPVTGGDVTKPYLRLDALTITTMAGKPITEIIDAVMSHAGFFLDKQLGLYTAVSSGSSGLGPTGVFMAYKIETRVTFAGQDRSGNLTEAVWDPARNLLARNITFVVRQYAVYSFKHPALPYYSNTTDQHLKEYNYVFTGQNTDIIGFNSSFDFTWYQTYLYQPDSVSSTTVNKQVKMDYMADLGDFNNPPPVPDTQGAIGTVTDISSFKIQPKLTDKRQTNDAGIVFSPAAQTFRDALLTRTDLLNIKLDIVGDPTLIPQDNWTIVLDPTKPSDYNDATMSESAFVNKYGFIRYSTKEACVGLTIKSPWDMDTELNAFGYNNTGLRVPNNAFVTSFSGQYFILSVDSVFERGQFKQTMTLSRNLTSNATALANGGTTPSGAKNTAAGNSGASSAYNASQR